MALRIIETKEVIEDGVTYIIKTYSNGTVVKSLKSEPVEPVEPVTPQPSQLDRMEEKIDTLVSGTTSENTEAINAFLGV